MDFCLTDVRGNLDQSIIDLAIDCAREAQFDKYKIKVDPHVVSETFGKFANDLNKLFVVARVNNKAVAMLMGEIMHYPFTNAKVAMELYFRVMEEYRGFGIGPAIIQHFENWAVYKECKFAIFGVNNLASNSVDDANRRVMNEGYKHYGTQYFKEL